MTVSGGIPHWRDFSRVWIYVYRAVKYIFQDWEKVGERVEEAYYSRE